MRVILVNNNLIIYHFHARLEGFEVYLNFLARCVLKILICLKGFVKIFYNNFKWFGYIQKKELERP